MTAPDPHPLFEDAAPDVRWTKGLPLLFADLRSEAIHDRKGRFAWRILRDGTVVGLRQRKDESYRMELRIGRPGTAEGKREDAEFEDRVADILRQLCIEPVDGDEPCVLQGNQWLRIPPDPEQDEGKAVQRLLELRQGECRPGNALCWTCLEAGELTQVPWWPSGGYRGQRCHTHALPERLRPRTDSKGQPELAI